MTKYLSLMAALALSAQLCAQPLFRPTNRTASAKAHLKFMQIHKKEAVKRAKIWKVPPEVVQLIASVQAGAAVDKEFNFGAVLPNPSITKFEKFSKTDKNGLIDCDKVSRAIEVIAVALHVLKNNNTPALISDEDYLQLIFGKGGDLHSMANEATIAYAALYEKGISFLPVEVVIQKPSTSLELQVATIANENTTKVTNTNTTKRVNSDITQQSLNEKKNQQATTNAIKQEVISAEREKIIAQAHLIASQRAEQEYALQQQRKLEKEQQEKGLSIFASQDTSSKKSRKKSKQKK